MWDYIQNKFDEIKIIATKIKSIIIPEISKECLDNSEFQKEESNVEIIDQQQSNTLSNPLLQIKYLHFLEAKMDYAVIISKILFIKHLLRQTQNLNNNNEVLQKTKSLIGDKIEAQTKFNKELSSTKQYAGDQETFAKKFQEVTGNFLKEGQKIPYFQIMFNKNKEILEKSLQMMNDVPKDITIECQLNAVLDFYKYKFHSLNLGDITSLPTTRNTKNSYGTITLPAMNEILGSVTEILGDQKSELLNKFSTMKWAIEVGNTKIELSGSYQLGGSRNMEQKENLFEPHDCSSLILSLMGIDPTNFNTTTMIQAAGLLLFEKVEVNSHNANLQQLIKEKYTAIKDVSKAIEGDILVYKGHCGVVHKTTDTKCTIISQNREIVDKNHILYGANGIIIQQAIFNTIDSVLLRPQREEENDIMLSYQLDECFKDLDKAIGEIIYHDTIFLI